MTSQKEHAPGNPPLGFKGPWFEVLGIHSHTLLAVLARSSRSYPEKPEITNGTTIFKLFLMTYYLTHSANGLNTFILKIF